MQRRDPHRYRPLPFPGAPQGDGLNKPQAYGKQPLAAALLLSGQRIELPRRRPEALSTDDGLPLLMGVRLVGQA